MIQDPVLRSGGGGKVVRSRAALELALNVYAAIATAVIVRLVLLALAVDDRIWLGSRVYALTAPLVAPFALLPGGGRVLVAAITLADLTLAAVMLLVPLWLVARHVRQRG
ncbi:MAG: hypothetical protein AVDCRST_MAG49-3224 [uncultured Thermomicrobiales bacterium]|uniref:YggT family protein n=1 Tax=uncultured Thermomicrobiales bacterium TaxID=1645740 RepID=A0A6J4V5R0_9BACT|nr:MAG: hypothetical protein AVDCRST_MAG49-3224 [uncultured Thermomicrobiales bacterium]